MHNYTNFDSRYYSAYHFYMVERALAATERNTDGKEEKVCVVFEYSQYELKNTIPLKLCKRFLLDLRDHYPERLQHIFLLDTPVLFRAFWMLVKVFVDQDTKAKVVFMTGEEAKRKGMSKAIAEDQAMPFMFPNGKKRRPINNEEFFEKIPFDHIFDED
jgi:hypothetical protein